MALQPNMPGKGKPAKAAPITAHPLFPAVVALWFGALFGLGSLAIRVGMLESLILATRIDTVIPAAGPPLGLSARILLALTLAALGAILGAAIARKIAAPKAVARERKRKAVLSADESVSLRSRDAHPDAPARRPLSVHDALDEANPVDTAASDDDAPEAEGNGDLLAGRRRSALAIEHDDTFELHELAPLPGGLPQILGPEPAGAAPLDLGSYASTEVLPPLGESPKLDWHATASQPADDAALRQVFHTDGEAVGHDAPNLPNFAPPVDAISGRQVFGMSDPQPDEVLDELGITDAEFDPLDTAGPADVPTATQALQDAQDMSDSSSPPGIAALAADPAQLPITDLAGRLAESMRRRRERAAQAAANSAVAADTVHAVAGPVEPGPAAPVVLPDAVPPTDFAHPNDIPAPPLSAITDLPPEPVAALQPHADQTGASALQPDQGPVPEADGLTLPGLVLPAALRPLALEPFADEDEDDTLSGFLPPRSFPGVGLFAKGAPVPGPIAEPQPAAEEADEADRDHFASSGVPTADFAGQPPAAAGLDAEPDAAATEDKYSSLLDLSHPVAPRQTFIRIEDEAPAAAAIEPVVVFPGQQPRLGVEAKLPGAGSAEEAPAPGAATALPGPFRQFDAPGSADAGQGIAPVAAVPHDPSETERALRAALANLQRMSGAA